MPILVAAPQILIQQYIGGTAQQYPGRLRTVLYAPDLSANAPQPLIIRPDEDGFIRDEGYSLG